MQLGASNVSVGFDLLVMAHLICVIGGFGFLAYSGAFLNLARRRGGDSATGALGVNRDLSTLAELLIVGALVFGVAAVGTSRQFYFSQAWVGAAMGGWLAAMAILHGWIRPNQRKFALLADQLAAAAAEAGTTSPGVAALNRVERAVSLGWGAFNLVVVAVVYLMVFKPGA